MYPLEKARAFNSVEAYSRYATVFLILLIKLCTCVTLSDSEFGGKLRFHVGIS